jgi:hypothetical protein
MENQTPAAPAAGQKKSNVGLIAGICAGVVLLIGIIVGVVIAISGGKDPVIGKYEAYATINKDGEEETTSISLMKAFGMSLTIEFKEDGTGEMVTSANTSMLTDGEDGEKKDEPQKEVAAFKWKDGKITDMKGDDGKETKEGTYELVKGKDGDKEVDFVLVGVSGSEDGEEKVKFKRIEEEKK